MQKTSIISVSYCSSCMDRVQIWYKLRTTQEKKTPPSFKPSHSNRDSVIEGQVMILSSHPHLTFCSTLLLYHHRYLHREDRECSRPPLTKSYLPRGIIWSSTLGIWKLFAAYYSILNNSSSPIVTQRALLVRLPFASAVTMTGLNGSLQLVYSAFAAAVY